MDPLAIDFGDQIVIQLYNVGFKHMYIDVVALGLP